MQGWLADTGARKGWYWQAVQMWNSGGEPSGVGANGLVGGSGGVAGTETGTAGFASK
jgi:hypothetical protein